MVSPAAGVKLALGLGSSAMRTSAKKFHHSGMEALSVLSATPAIGEVTAPDRYVSAPDSSYRYELIETIPGDGYAAHVLEIYATLL
jgi:hypothetical protein